MLLFSIKALHEHTFVPAGEAKQLFVLVLYFPELHDFVKIELLSVRELDFEGSRSLKMQLRMLCSNFRKLKRCWRLKRRGGGGKTPQENLSGLGGLQLISEMLMGTGTQLLPKKALPAGGLEARLGAAGKRLRVS